MFANHATHACTAFRQSAVIVLAFSAFGPHSLGQRTLATEVAESQNVRLVAVGEVLIDPSQTIVITHGYGGTASGDRFHRLAEVLKQKCPTANVFRLDWSVAAGARLAGWPNPWLVARRIDPTGDLAAELLHKRGVDPATTTLIGESFGVFVNHRIALRFGRVAKVLGFNPAHEAGGYTPPTMADDAEQVFVFSTTSCFDTQTYLGGHALVLETESEMGPFEQHTFGIEWMCIQLDRGDATWLQLTVNERKPDIGHLSSSV